MRLRYEFIIVGIVIAAAAGLFLMREAMLGGEGALYAEIQHNSELVMTVALAEDAIFSPEGMPNVVFEVRDGSIAFIEADCPDQVCINTGALHRAGQVAVCLPNGLIVQVVADTDPDIDVFI